MEITDLEKELLELAFNKDYCLSEYFNANEIHLLVPVCKKLIRLGLIANIILYGDAIIYLTQKGRYYINNQIHEKALVK